MHHHPGYDPHEQNVVSLLASPHQNEAPFGFVDWLKNNNANYDPVLRAWDRRGEPALQSSYHDRRRPYCRHFYRCADETCVHYIYGFSQQDELDQHSKTHILHAKRDSGLSVGGVASNPFCLEPEPGLLSSSILSPSSPTRLPGNVPLQDDKLKLPPLQEAAQNTSWRGFAGSFSFAPRPPNLARTQSSNSMDMEVDPLLPPLKRSRIGPSRLKSIGELMLLRESDTCLRCKTLNLEVCSISILTPRERNGPGVLLPKPRRKCGV